MILRSRKSLILNRLVGSSGRFSNFLADARKLQSHFSAVYCLNLGFFQSQESNSDVSSPVANDCKLIALTFMRPQCRSQPCPRGRGAAYRVDLFSANFPRPRKENKSKDDLQPKLNIEWLARTESGITQSGLHGAADGPESRVAESVIWPGQIQRVENIEELGSQLYLHSFCDRSGLDYS